MLDLRRRCTAGTHHIEIVIKNNGWFPQPGIEEYAWLAGDFRIEQKEEDLCLMAIRGIKLGPWEEQGFPNFSGTAAYYIDITLGNEILEKRAFVVTDRVGDLLEVEVNGAVAGVRAWPPYRVEVTSLLCADKNLFVLKVTNSALNFFEGLGANTPSGLLSPVWLEIEEP